MRQRAICTLIGVIALSTQSASGAIVTVGFESQPVAFYTTVSDSGFVFTNFDPEGTNSAMVIGNPSFYGPPGPDNGTLRWLGSVDSNSIISVQQSGGGSFSLLRFDLAEGHSERPLIWAESVVVTGYLSGGGTVSTSVVPDFIQDGPGGAADFQTFVLPASFTNLTKVEFAGAGPSLNYYTLDNIRFETAEVPEPASLALFGLGGLGLVAAHRRRRVA
jgi:hypothetical protein